MPESVRISKDENQFVSYAALAFGIICFAIVFVSPVKLVHTGSLMGDAIVILFTMVGLVLSVAGLLLSTNKKIISVLALVLCSSFFISWVMMVIAL